MEPGGLRALTALIQLPTLLLLIALGLWLGGRGPMKLSSPLLLGTGLAIGLVVQRWGFSAASLAPLFLTLVAGALIALDQDRRLAVERVLFPCAGLLTGLTWPSHLAPYTLAMSAVLSVMLPTAIGFYFSLLPPHPACMIGRRVLASWLLAVSLLALAFAFKGQAA